MRELLDAGLLDGDAMTVTGRTLGETLADIGRSTEPQTPVLHTVAEPVKATGGYAVLWGNLAPEGSVIKVANQAATWTSPTEKLISLSSSIFTVAGTSCRWIGKNGRSIWLESTFCRLWRAPS